MDSLGFPATLRRQINNEVLQANQPDRQDTIWLRSVVAWHTWLSYEQNSIRYLRPGHDGDYDYLNSTSRNWPGWSAAGLQKIISVIFLKSVG